ncbi:MAG TPA: S8 family serine peptidase [Acidimicrobiales bacterium]|nr:S8 family serine peptidase [Acidimicrobiales bacterium]
MGRGRLAKILLGVGLLSASASPAVASTAVASTAPYVVVLRDGVDAAAKAQADGAAPTHVYHAALDGYAAVLSDTVKARVERDRDVLFVAPDQQFKAFDPVKKFGGFDVPTQFVPSALQLLGGLASPTARVDGVDQRVDMDIAVLDTGIDTGHPDLNVVGGVGCANGTSIEDGNGHGTHVAGRAAALDNGIGLVGVAPGARLWSVRVLNDQGVGSTSSVICGVDWVTAHADVIDVANMSLGSKGVDDGNCGRTKPDAFHQAICRSVAAGVTYVVSAGNDASDAAGFIPAAYDEVITVSAMASNDGEPGSSGPYTDCLGRTTLDESFAYFSNYGPVVDLIAPGFCITSTWLDGKYATISGTSMAAPQVSGAAALYKATHPTATPAQVRSALVGAGTLDWLTSTDPDPFHEPLPNVAGF